MRRTIAIVSCLVVSCFAALAVWMYMRDRSDERGRTVELNGSNGQASNKSSGATEKTALDSAVFALPVRVAYLGDEQFSPCFVDRGKMTLYRWKGVILERDLMEETPYAEVPSGIRVLIANDFSVIPVEAPVHYLEVKGEYRVGYLDPTIWAFYAWKGVVLGKQQLLDKSQDGLDAIVKPEFTRIHVLEIDMPAHLKEHPELWKKT